MELANNAHSIITKYSGITNTKTIHFKLSVQGNFEQPFLG